MNIVFSMRRRPAIQPVAVVTRHQFGDADTPLCLDAQIAPAASSAMTEAFGAPSFRSFFEHAGIDALNAWPGSYACPRRTPHWRADTHRQVRWQGNGDAVSRIFNTSLSSYGHRAGGAAL